jgi:UDP-GlcNAc:undecaprenyl-phosphate GlcNAc-1-phosphate transferase
MTVTTALWLVVFGVGFGFFLTWLGRGVAARLGFVDFPDRQRKTQSCPVPVAGGVAVLGAVILALTVTAFALPDVYAGIARHSQRAAALLVAALLIVAVGLGDDRYNLRARYKLLGQLAAILVLILWGGFLIQRVGLFGVMIELGPLAVPCTAVWMLGCVNALNLIDGMDGLLGIVGGIALASLAVIVAMTGYAFESTIALAFAGAVLGFLWWNLPPATVYMGDSGSMLIGLVIGAVAIPTSLKGPAAVALSAPLAILVLPIFDTAAAVIRRKLTGRGLATADRGHLHHVLMRNGLTVPRVLVIVGVLGLIAAGGALASTALNNDLFALIAAGGVVAALIAGKLFGNAELRLIHKRLAAAVRGVWPGRAARQPWELAIRLQGSADWDHVWEDLTGVAHRLNFQTICLDVNAPAMHENYHARWDQPGGPPAAFLWRLEVPLFIKGTPIGRLSVSAERDDQSLVDVLQILVKIVEVAEVRAAEVADAPTKSLPALTKLSSPAKSVAPEPAVAARV